MKPTSNSLIRNSQRLSHLAGLLTVALGSLHAAPVVLLKYEMGLATPQIQDPINGAAGGTLTKGSGLNAFVFNSTLGYPSQPILNLNFVANTTTLAAAQGNNSYFTFTLTAGAGTTDIDLTSLSFDAAKGGASDPRGVAVYVTPPGGVETLLQGATNLTAGRFAFQNINIDLTGQAGLQNLSAGQVATFKIYAFSPAAGSALDFDNITVNGEGGAVVVVDQPGTRTKANNTNDLNLLSSWATGAVPPTTAEVTQWNDVVLGANSTLLGADLSWQGIRILNPGGPVTIGGANTLTLGTAGINMATATQNLTIGSGLTLGPGIQTWNVAAAHALTLNTGTFTRPTGTTLNLPGAGTVASTMTNLSTNTGGIVGAWATTGTGATTQYATFTGSNIGALTGTAAADGSALTDTTGAVNYDLATFGGTVPADVSASTIRYFGAEGATSTGLTGFSVNGLMNVGTGIWTVDSNPLTIGSGKELVVNTATSGITLASAIQDNIGGASALTKLGTGVLTLSGLGNAYTGPTTVNSGVLDVGLISNGSLGAAGLFFRNDAVLQGNGTFTRNFSGLTTAANNEISGFTGGFAAKGGPLTVNFGGASASVSLSGVSPKFGTNFILGSATADNKVTVVNPIALNGGQRLITVTPGLGGDSAEFSGVLSGTTPSGVNKQGGGLLLLSAANTYTGNTTVANGILQISNANALGTPSPTPAATATSVSTGGSLQLTGGITTDPFETVTINGTGSTNVGALQAGTGGGTWAGPVVVGNASARVGAIAGSTLMITGAISGANGLAISGGGGTGVVVLNPGTTNVYTGQTTIVRGILRLGKNDALPITSVLDAKDPANSPDAAVFDLNGFSQVVAGLTDSGAFANDIVTNSSAATTSTLTINNAAAYTFDGVIENGAGTTAIIKYGTATQILNGANTYSGTTLVNVGGLSIRNNDALGDTLGATTVAVTGTTAGNALVVPPLAAGGRLILSNNITCPENINLTGNSEQTGGFNASIDSTSDANYLTGNITLVGTGGQRINATGALGVLNLNGTVSRDGSNAGDLVLRTGVATATLNVNNTIDLNGGGLNIQGLGAVYINSPVTDIVSATVGFGGTALALVIGADNALPPTCDLTLGTTNGTAGNDQGDLDLAGYSLTVRQLGALRSSGLTPAAAAERKITNSNANPSIITAGNTTISTDVSTFDGVIEDGVAVGGVALTKIGAGTLVLTGPNTYTGATTVSEGALALVGGSQASPITVATGAFLGFTLGAPTTSTAAVDLSLGKVRITGTPAPATSYTLLTTTATITGTPVIETPIAGFNLVVEGGNVLKLIPAGNAPYSDWLTANPPATGFVTDSDKDGVPNGLENVLGTNPNTSSAGLTQVSATAGSATFKHTLNPNIAGDVTYSYQWSTDLTQWKASTETNTGGTTVTITPSAPVSGVVTVTGNITSGPASRLFLRIDAKKQP